MSDSSDPLLAAAWQLPVAAIYQRTGLVSQRLRAMCGPTSAVVVLRSLGVAAEQTTVLEGTRLRTLFGARLAGMTLDEMAEVVRTHSRRPVTALRDLDLDRFREELRRVNDPARRYIVNFDRNLLFGWGGGHHSPLGGYLEKEDRALVLDVNARVGPWLVSAERLHAAVTTRDRSSQKARGLVRID